jgi:hypothetical protein
MGLLALKRLLAILCTGALVVSSYAASPPNDGAPSSRVEAQSASFLAVGVVHGERMIVHLSRLLDNAPVSDAVVTVVLRGAAHPTTAETDGSYTFEAKELALPGAASVEFEVSRGGVHESLKSTLQIAGAAGIPQEKTNARQLWWWVLNFVVCIGFLWLYSRRRKGAQGE